MAKYLDSNGLLYFWQKIKNLFAPLASPTFTGAPKAPTPTSGDNSTNIATTAYVQNAIGSVSTGVTGVKGDAEVSYRTGQVNLTPANIGLGNVDNTADASKSVASAATLTTARTIDGVSFDGSGGITHIATTTTHSTSSSSSNYVVAQSNFEKQTGARIVICAANFPLSSAATGNKVYLNINNTGLSSAWYKGTNLTNGMLTRGNAYEFVYDGSHYVLVGELDTNTVYTHPTYTAHSTSEIYKFTNDATGHIDSATAATASDVVSLLGTTPVNRATADASGANIADTYAKKADITGIYQYKGSVATENALPASPSTGDVYNIESSSSYGAAGANVAWNGTAWDSLGEIFTITSITNAEVDTIVAS